MEKSIEFPLKIFFKVFFKKIEIPYDSAFPLLSIYLEKTKILEITNAGEGVEKKEPSYIVGGNINWSSYYGKQYGTSLKKLHLIFLT